LITQAESRPVNGGGNEPRRIGGGFPADDWARKMRPEMKRDMRRALQLLMMPAVCIVWRRRTATQAWPPYLGPLDAGGLHQYLK